MKSQPHGPPVEIFSTHPTLRRALKNARRTVGNNVVLDQPRSAFGARSAGMAPAPESVPVVALSGVVVASDEGAVAGAVVLSEGAGVVAAGEVIWLVSLEGD
jgi:hypothetical protein